MDAINAYIAGYFDAEGCVGLAFSDAWSCYVQFKQTQPHAITFILEYFFGALWIEEVEKGRRLLRLRFQSFDETTRFLRTIAPLCKEKRDQVVRVLESYTPTAATNWQLKRELEELKERPADSIIIEKHLAIASRDPNRRCLVVGCERKSFARGRCSPHYNTARARGEFKPRKRTEGVPFEYGRVPSDVEKVYLAGYFDGDGCTLVRGRKYGWDPKVHFGQSQFHVIKLMHEIYHGSLSQRTVKSGCKPIIDLQIVQREAALAFLRDVQPYTKEKRDQVDAILTRYAPHMSKSEGQKLQKDLTAMKKRTYTRAEFEAIIDNYK